MNETEDTPNGSPNRASSPARRTSFEESRTFVEISVFLHQTVSSPGWPGDRESRLSDLALIDECIQKWEQNAGAPDLGNVRLGPINCPLCLKHHHLYRRYRVEASSHVTDNCGFCPIALKTGAAGCVKSPYAEAATEFEKWEKVQMLGILRGPKSEELHRYMFMRLAGKELEFLKEVRSWFLNQPSEWHIAE